MNKLWHALTRRKRFVAENEDTKLARVLNLFDLTALGVGSTLGLGVYVLAGAVSINAGPAVTLSFLIAAITSALSATCYVEFAARIPKAGSAYVYTYVSVGEFLAFTIGWNLILEYIIGTSSVARGLSVYLDSLLNNRMSHFFRNLAPMNIDFLAPYPDFFSFVIVILLSLLLSVGVKESSIMNNIFSTINIVTVLIVIGSGIMIANPANWSIPKESIPSNVNGGEGGFMPFGIAGVMAGAAKCFYAFVGFDCLASCGEEAKNPRRNIPLSMILALFIVFFSYFGVSTVLTMMLPYYEQNAEAPLPHVYDKLGWIGIKWIVSIGAVFALCTSLLGAMFPLPRILYAMSSDGLLYSTLSQVNKRTKTPVNATIIAGFVAAAMALMFDLNQLIDMMSIGTLLAYTIVAVCVIVLRYQEDETAQFVERAASSTTVARQLLNLNFIKHSNSLTSNIAKLSLIAFCCVTMIACVLVDIDTKRFPLSMIFLYAVIAILLILTVFVARQPQTKCDSTFKVPFVPFLPLLSIFLNLYLMFQLDIHTWIRFAIWLVIGYVIFFSYGMRSSVEGNRLKIESSEHGAANTKTNYSVGVYNANTNMAYISDNAIDSIKK